MPQRTASEVADLLEEIGRRAAFEGDNPYKSKAYLRAAASLRQLGRPIAELIKAGTLQTLPGVGADANLPVARVDEVVEPPSAATPAPASDGSNVWIVALGGGVLAALMAGLLLRIRHRRASTPPAAPEAPG